MGPFRCSLKILMMPWQNLEGAEENTEYTSELYKTMSSQLSETFTKQERAMKEAIKEIDEMQSSYMKTADRIIPG